MWNYLKASAYCLAAFALAGPLVTVASAQITYTPIFGNVWVVDAGNFTDLPANSGNNVRGIAISPLTTNVLYGSTAAATNAGIYGGNNHVSTVAFDLGSNFVAQTKTSPSGAQVNLTTVRVSDDGYVYGCNVTTAPTGANQIFQVFRWNSDTDTTAEPIIVFSSTNVFAITNIANTGFPWRLGDFMDLRGSGLNTEIVVAGNSATSTNLVLLRPTDATATLFTNFNIYMPGSQGAAAGLAGRGVAFEGTNNAFYVNNASQVRRLTFNPSTLIASAVVTNTIDGIGLDYYESTNGVKLLATVKPASGAGVAQIARIYQIPAVNNGGAMSLVLNSNLTAVAGSANGNAVGQVDAKKGYFAFGAPGHGLSFFKVDFITTAPPSSLVLSATASTVVSTYPVTLTASVSGSLPLTYQFYFTNGISTNLLISATTNAYAIASAQATNQGGYFVIVTNAYGKATSGIVNLTVLPQGFSNLATQLWTLAPGSRSYLTTTDQQRGLGYDPILKRVLVVNRATTNIIVLDAATGADLGKLDTSLFFNPPPSGFNGNVPGTFPVNMCGVADDGAVYVGNLLTGIASSSFEIFRWGSSDTNEVATEAYAGQPGIDRIGDAMAVRGAGLDTQILCSFRNNFASGGTNIAIFTTADGLNFNLNVVGISGLPADAAGLSLYWGSGNTFWAKSDSLNNIRQISFDLNTLTGTVIGSYPLLISQTIIGVDSANGYVATIGTRETPHSLAIYDVNAPGGLAINAIQDRELFPTSNVNGNFVGQIAMDVAGGRIFALDCNNGVLAVSYAGKLGLTPSAGEQVLTWPVTAATLQATTNLTLPFADVLGATSPYTNTTDSAKFFRLKK
jgi:hypothetical protein